MGENYWEDKRNREKMREKGYLIPVQDQEIIKHKDLGMIESYMTKKERLSMSQLLGLAYDMLLDDMERMVFSVDTDKFLELINTDKVKLKHAKIFKSKRASEETNKYSVEATIEKLVKNPISLRYKDKETGEYTVAYYSILSSAKLTKRKLEFEFTRWVRERILMKGGNYIIAQKTYAILETTYGLAMYELILQRENMGEWRVDLELFKRLMGAEGKYEGRFDNLRRKIIDVAVNDVNTATEYALKYETIRKGRKIVSLRFSWKPIPKMTHKAKWIKDIKKRMKEKTIAILADGKMEVELFLSREGMLRDKRNKNYNIPTGKAKEYWEKLFQHRDEIGSANEAPRIWVGDGERFLTEENRGDAKNITMNEEVKKIIANHQLSIPQAQALFKKFKNHYQSLPPESPKRTRSDWTLVFENWIIEEEGKGIGEIQKVTDEYFRIRRNVSDMIKDSMRGQGIDPEEIALEKEMLKKAGIDWRTETSPVSMGGTREKIWFYIDKSVQENAEKNFRGSLGESIESGDDFIEAQLL